MKQEKRKKALIAFGKIGDERLSELSPFSNQVTKRREGRKDDADGEMDESFDAMLMRKY